MKSSTAIISYSWDSEDHKKWVRNLAARLRKEGIEIILDQWHTVPGDELPKFMETAVRENDFVIIVCTPRYKDRSDNRIGGVGYEGNIMTAEIMTTQNQRKFIPILRVGPWKAAAPSWLLGKYYIDFSSNPYAERNYSELVMTLTGNRPQAPPVGVAAVPRLPSAQMRPSVGLILGHSVVDTEGNTQKIYRLEEYFWNPHGIPPATPKVHAVALRDISVTVSQPRDNPTSMIDVFLTYRLVSYHLGSIGYEHAPWLHLEFFNGRMNPIPIEEAMHWEVFEFEPYEDRMVEKHKRIPCSQFADIAYARVWAGRGYAGSDFPPDGHPRVSIAASMRHFLGKWQRRVKHGRR